MAASIQALIDLVALLDGQMVCIAIDITVCLHLLVIECVSMSALSSHIFAVMCTLIGVV